LNYGCLATPWESLGRSLCDLHCDQMTTAVRLPRSVVYDNAWLSQMRSNLQSNSEGVAIRRAGVCLGARLCVRCCSA